MVLTRSQAGAEEQSGQAVVFEQPPRSPSAETNAPPASAGVHPSLTSQREALLPYTSGGEVGSSAEKRAEWERERECERERDLDDQRRRQREQWMEAMEQDEHSRPTHAHPRKARSITSRRSTASAVARLKYEAEEKLAAIKRKELQLEARLIQMKLDSEIAAIESDGNSEEEESANRVEERVNYWLNRQRIESETPRGESSRPSAPAVNVTPAPRPPRTERQAPPTARRRVEWNTPRRERSPTPVETRRRGIEQLAETLDKMMRNRPPPRQATDLPIFSGAPSEWLQYKAAMEETTRLYRFTAIENLARIRNSLRGEAKEAVAPLLSAATHPDQVMHTLEQCFGRPEVLMDRVLEELKHLPKLGGSASELNTFSVKVLNAVAVLKTLKPKYLHNPLMVREVLEKLSPYLKSKWCDYAEEEAYDEDTPEIVQLSHFLMREADRALKHSYSPPAPATTSKREATKPFAKKEAKKPVFTANTETEDNSVQKTASCAACDQEHWLSKCPKFKKMEIQERWDLVKGAGLCFKCISKKHRKINCRAKGCGVDGCRRWHHQLLHSSEGATRKEEPTATFTADANEEEETVAASITTEKEVKLKICPVTVSGSKGKAQIYALFDEGSTVTLLDGEVAQAIGAEGPAKVLNMRGINADRREMKSRLVKLKISGRDRKEHEISARTITGMNITSQSIPEKLLQLKHLKDLDPEELCYKEAKPQLLIGSDNWHLIVSRELRLGKKGQPAASKTQLGWVIHGSIPKRIMKKEEEDVLHIATVGHHEELEDAVKKHFSMDALGISLHPRVNKSDQRAIDIFEKTAKRREDGHYEVGLPWCEDDVKLPRSYNAALRRLKNLEQKLEKNPSEQKKYEEQVNNLITKGYAEKCDGSEANSPVAWYLPHFAVKNINKPGKFRMVFDAAAKSCGKSLNDFILEGPDLLRSLPAILFRFREEAVAVTADIQEMFLRIKIRKEDQPAQMFLWRTNKEEPPVQYKMTSMIFGARSSPFLAHSVRNRNAEDYANSHPAALQAITEAHYMDDYVCSYSTKEEAKKTIEEVDYVHSRAGFHLRGWNTNVEEVLENVPVERRGQTTTQPITKDAHYEKTLGLLWDSAHDVLKFNTSLNRVNQEVKEGKREPTKREALSAVMSIYDPLGLLSCYTITAKIALQNLWRQKLDWDDPIPTDSAEDFARWLNELERISHLQLPRSYNGGSPVKKRHLHVFCDASKEAYAAAAYWRLEQEDGDIRVELIAAKSRVAPLKAQTIPRMELQAALIGARLGDHIIKEHRWSVDGVTYWTDAQVVLHWLKNENRRYTPYVAHRLGEITELSSVHQWRWVPTQQNVADLATRPGYVPGTHEDPWFTGPEFLKKPMEEWPTNLPVQDIEDPEATVLHTMEGAPKCLPDIGRFSNYERLIRTTARILLFIERCRGRKKAKLEVEHLKKAEKLWIQKAQNDDFGAEIAALFGMKKIARSSPLYRLDPIYEEGLLRINGRTGAADVPDEAKKPIILDGRHPFTRLLVANEHRKAGHANRERVVNDLRQKYWILKLRPTVRLIARECAFCRVRRATPRTPPKGDLPRERLGAFQRPFSNCGLDYFGPLVVTIGRRHEKRWGALFTCLTTRAVHLELVASLSTDSAIMAIRRMAARRGWPTTMYSDNGTNFKGANQELRAAYQEWKPAMEELGLQHRMQWKFIPPGAPNQGGAWERLVRSVKTALAATLNEKNPKEEVLQTLMTEAEYTVNARPLTHVSVDPSDPEALTPNHFLIGSSTGMPYVGPCEPADRRIWRVSQALADEYWKRWVKEYLPDLVARQDPRRSERPLSKGDIVIVVDPQLPRNTWPRGIIEQTYPGPDRQVRSANVRTAGGVFRRPTSRLAILQMAEPAVNQ